MKKKVIICILLAGVFLLPIPMRLKDGGTVKYNALLYTVSDVHKMYGENEYSEVTIVEILGVEVFNNVQRIIVVQ